MQAISYNSTVFPVILGVLFMSVVYKFLQKHIPVFLKTIVVPLLTMLITAMLAGVYYLVGVKP